MSSSVRLREERKRLNMTLDNFSSMGGVKKRSQINYEQGVRSPDAKYLSRLAAHGVDVGYIITGVPKGKVLNKEEEELLECFANISPGIRGSFWENFKKFLCAENMGIK